MSQTQSTTKAVLSAEEKVAYNNMLEAFIFRAMKINNLTARDMPVIITPELHLVEGEWVPKQGNGARIIASNDNVFVRLTQPYRKVVRQANGSDKITIEFLTHNAFFTTKEWSRLCHDANYGIGSILPNVRIVVEETTEPSVSLITGKVNNGWQPKTAGENGAQLTSNGKAIYRRTVLRSTVDEETGEALVVKSEKIAHDNVEQLRSNAFARLAENARKAVNNNINLAEKEDLSETDETATATTETTETTTV